jgi:hypothetical protein
MEVKKVRKKIVIFLLFLVALCITQCSPKRQIVKEDEETVLRRRVQEYWSYKIKGEWEKSYLYESPEFREKVSKVAYINQNRRSIVKWEGFDVLEIWISGEEGHVKVDIKYRYIIPQTQKGAFEKVAEETWIKKDGQWYCISPFM